jgi:dTDP-4-amino-4,6-dideoxygalactose transaminase
MFIPFSKAPFVSKSLEYVKKVLESGKTSGDFNYSLLCHKWLRDKLGCKFALTVSSGTAALELSALAIGIQPGDEVIMPSYTFSSTANAFLLRGAKIIFVDIRPDTLNLDESLLEQAITKNTKVVVPVHYAGVPCEMDVILEIAKIYNLYVVEDAAQSILSTYKGKQTGTIGHFGCFSFHSTKNFSCGEGGAIVFNDQDFLVSIEIIREKGTNRSQFFRGEVDKYTWRDIGSSYLLSDISSAVLYAQLEISDEILHDRLNTWNYFFESLKELREKEYIRLPTIPKTCTHNAHIFYIITRSLEERTKLLDFCKSKNIMATFHYVPLHSSPAGQRFSKFIGLDRYTTSLSERLVRLPIYYNMKQQEKDFIVESIFEFYKQVI